MDKVDTTIEWQRLEELYGGLSDEELEGLANEAYDLTDLAKQALQTEMGRRRMNVSLKAAASPPEPDEGIGDFDPGTLDLVILTRVWDLSSARHVKDVLDGEGIPAYLGDDNLDDAKLFPSNFEGGMDMKVRDRDQQRALDALAHAGANDADEAATTEDDANSLPECPRCHSPEIVFLSLQKETPEQSDFNSRYNWRCDACGLRWQDDGGE